MLPPSEEHSAGNGTSLAEEPMHELSPTEMQEVREAALKLSGKFSHLSAEQQKQVFELIGSQQEEKLQHQSVRRKAKQPKGWSAESTVAYYQPKYALEIKRIVDHMLQEHTEKKGDKTKCLDRLVESRKYRVSPRTLIMRFTQGFLYLVHHMDTPDKLYHDLREEISICRDGQNVRLKWKIKPSEDIIAVPAEHRSMKWKEDFEDFLEKAQEGQVLELKNKGLLQEDLDYISNSLIGIKGFYILILDANKTRILRTDVEEEEIKD